jgi:hypothetical protein
MISGGMMADIEDPATGIIVVLNTVVLIPRARNPI